MQAFLAGGQWLNFIALALQVLNMFTNTFPDLAQNHVIMAIQAAVGILLPSLRVPVVAPNGVAHALQGTITVPDPSKQ